MRPVARRGAVAVRDHRRDLRIGIVHAESVRIARSMTPLRVGIDARIGAGAVRRRRAGADRDRGRALRSSPTATRSTSSSPTPSDDEWLRPVPERALPPAPVAPRLRQPAGARDRPRGVAERVAGRAAAGRPAVRRDGRAGRRRGHALPGPGRLHDRDPQHLPATRPPAPALPGAVRPLGAGAARAGLPHPLRAGARWWSR